MVKIRFDLLEEIEKELNISPAPMTWPINSGKEFKGVYNLHEKKPGAYLRPVQKRMKKMLLSPLMTYKIHVLDEKIGERDAATLREDVELIDGSAWTN